MVNSAGTCRDRGVTERIQGPGHWMQLEAPDVVNGLLVDFLPGLSGALP